MEFARVDLRVRTSVFIYTFAKARDTRSLIDSSECLKTDLEKQLAVIPALIAPARPWQDNRRGLDIEGARVSRGRHFQGALSRTIDVSSTACRKCID